MNMRIKDIGGVLNGRVNVRVVTPQERGHGLARVELVVYGARYPWKLDEHEARELAASLTAGAEELAAGSSS
jgi:hypothetical protein